MTVTSARAEGLGAAHSPRRSQHCPNDIGSGRAKRPGVRRPSGALVLAALSSTGQKRIQSAEPRVQDTWHFNSKQTNCHCGHGVAGDGKAPELSKTLARMAAFPGRSHDLSAR
jgi:hypothetical protein